MASLAGAAHGGAEEEVDHQHHHEEGPERDAEVEEPDGAPGAVRLTVQGPLHGALSLAPAQTLRKRP